MFCLLGSPVNGESYSREIDNRRGGGAANRSHRRSTERNPSRAAVGAFIHEAPEIRVRFHLQPTPPLTLSGQVVS